MLQRLSLDRRCFEDVKFYEVGRLLNPYQKKCFRTIPRMSCWPKWKGNFQNNRKEIVMVSSGAFCFVFDSFVVMIRLANLRTS
jgi:hypothetical protein